VICRQVVVIKWDWPMRPIKSGPLTNREIKELDAFLLADDSLENAMDVSTIDGFLCAVVSGPKVVMPSEWVRWIWDMDEGEQSPVFVSENQAQRILNLLIRHANDIALTLIEAPQYYEPLFFKRDVKGRAVSIVDEWCSEGHGTRFSRLATAHRSAA
jgi:uncharacterized protein